LVAVAGHVLDSGGSGFVAAHEMRRVAQLHRAERLDF
jgi:hypothetical protein